jgi:electron transfer flavoprotein alpha subunit
VSRVVHFSTSGGSQLTSEAVAGAVAGAVRRELSSADPPAFVVGASTKFGSAVLPRAAAMLGVSPVTDVVRIESPGAFFPSPFFFAVSSPDAPR